MFVHGVCLCSANKIPSREETWQLFYKCCLRLSGVHRFVYLSLLRCMAPLMTINMWKLIFICCLNISFLFLLSRFVMFFFVSHSMHAPLYWIANISRVYESSAIINLLWGGGYNKRRIYSRIVKGIKSNKMWGILRRRVSHSAQRTAKKMKKTKAVNQLKWNHISGPNTAYCVVRPSIDHLWEHWKLTFLSLSFSRYIH